MLMEFCAIFHSQGFHSSFSSQIRNNIETKISLRVYSMEILVVFGIFIATHLSLFQQLLALKNLLTTFYVNKNIDYNCIKHN